MNEEKQYVYIFTRQDISPEQQLVQSAHVAMKLGFLLGEQHGGDYLDPDNTYFTVVGVRGIDGLQATADILLQNHFKFECFVEPDIGNQLTSIATHPIPESERGVLLAFSWLRF